MPLEQDDLQVGDVMIMRAQRKLTHALIAAGQAIFSHNLKGAGALSVHPAIYCGRGQVIEATGGGLRKRLADGNWTVFRYNRINVALEAGLVAVSKLRHRNRDGNFGNYSQAKAFASLFHSSSLGRRSRRRLTRAESETRSYFCSEFVIQCYSEAAGAGAGNEPIRAGRVTSPKEMHARLNSDNRWDELGTFSP